MIPCANPLSQYLSHKAEIDSAVMQVLLSNKYILGPEVAAFENEFAAYIGAGHGIGVANGTDALEIAMRALEIGPGDEVITVAHTAVATVAAIEATGATPVLVDVDPFTYTLNAQQLPQMLTTRTKAVIAVHIYGQAADLDEIGAFCSNYGLALIEDVSQAHGATWNGRRLGSFGTISCFSCYPTKNLGAIGDGGIVCTSDKPLANKVRMLREYGWKQRYISELQGRNSRLDEIQAAILRMKLRHLDASNAKRRAIAARYDALIDNPLIERPAIRAQCDSVYHLYVVRSQQRDALMRHLNEHDIHPGIHYPVPVHLQNAYLRRVRTAPSMAVTEALSAQVLSLPMFPELSGDEVETVARAVLAFRG